MTMMKFEVKSRWTGDVLFTADIECDQDSPIPIKFRLAVEWARKTGASLDGANLYGANLDGASLDGANLDGASLTGAILAHANLDGASLDGAIGDGTFVKSLQIGTYPIAYTATVMQIGCQRHEIEKWWSFNDKVIAKMDYCALSWWQIAKPILQANIAAFPARPTEYVAPTAESQTS